MTVSFLVVRHLFLASEDQRQLSSWATTLGPVHQPGASVTAWCPFARVVEQPGRSGRLQRNTPEDFRV